MRDPFFFAVLAMTVFFLLIWLAVILLLARPWLRALLHGTPVSLVNILAMRLRGNPPILLIDAYIALMRAGVSTTMLDVENAYIDCRSRVLTSDDLAELVKKRIEA